MRVTFCGHSMIDERAALRAWLEHTLERLINEGADRFYLGGYGDFDALAAQVVKGLKTQYLHIESVIVLPYPDKQITPGIYDASVYPPLEKVPRRFCIVKRNLWMVENADVVVSYVLHDWGGASKTYEHAVKKGKRVINYPKSDKKV